MGQPDDAGTPDPLDFRRHRTVDAPLGGQPPGVLGAACPFVNGTPITKLIPVAGALSVTLRGLFAATGGTGSGTLSFQFMRPAPFSTTPYATNNPANVAVTGGTEFIVTINPNGEAWMLVTFTPSGNGVVTYFDQMQL